jgi:hypothetical protein
MNSESLTAEHGMVEILGIEWDDEREAIAIAMKGEPTEEEAKMINALMYAFADFLGDQMEFAGQQVREWLEENGGSIH